METSIPSRVLKAGRSRTVFEEEVDGRTTIVKRFHHPDRLQSLRDAGRARSEYRALRHLSEFGVRAPAPLEIRTTENRWEVRMEAIAGSRTLDQLFDSKGVDWNRLSERLGRLLARLHAARVDHPDLHPGNVLVDAEETPWLIDFHTAKLRRRPLGGRILLRDLIAAAAVAREVLPAGARARFHHAWRRELEDSDAVAATAVGSALRDVGAIEAEARRARRAAVAHGAGRWLRESSRCRVTSDGSSRIWEPTESARRGAPAPVASELLTLELSVDEGNARWLNAARLFEHRIPVACPLRLEVRDESAVAHFALREAPNGVLPSDLSRARELLTDRGLALADLSLDDCIEAVPGGFVLLPPRYLGELTE